MHVTLFMAASLNGLIARPDYREDFLSRENWDSFLDCTARTGAFIWGRKTHEKFRRYWLQYLERVKDFAKVVVSTDRGFSVEEGFELASSPRDALAVLESKGLSAVTLAGGGILNAAFAQAGLIDDLAINIEAVVVGRGIPLFAPEDFDLTLELVDARRITERIVQIRCLVKKADQRD